jgi:hypothetical protein
MYQALGANDIATSRLRLQAIDRYEQDIKVVSHARNQLESRVYELKDLLEDSHVNNAGKYLFSHANFLVLMKMLDDTATWLNEHISNHKTDLKSLVKQFDDKLKSINTAFESLTKKQEKEKSLHHVIDDCKLLFAAARDVEDPSLARLVVRARRFVYHVVNKSKREPVGAKDVKTMQRRCDKVKQKLASHTRVRKRKR